MRGRGREGEGEGEGEKDMEEGRWRGRELAGADARKGASALSAESTRLVTFLLHFQALQ